MDQIVNSYMASSKVVDLSGLKADDGVSHAEQAVISGDWGVAYKAIVKLSTSDMDTQLIKNMINGNWLCMRLSLEMLTFKENIYCIEPRPKRWRLENKVFKASDDVWHSQPIQGLLHGLIREVWSELTVP